VQMSGDNISMTILRRHSSRALGPRLVKYCKYNIEYYNSKPAVRSNNN
jgi:hypothetical protein